MEQPLSLGGLFLSAFISSTILPGSSEILLVLLNQQHQYSPWLLLALASSGNTLGGLTTWGMGRLTAIKFGAEKLKKAQYLRAVNHLHKWGSPALLFSWIPVLGDPLCFAAGWLRIGIIQVSLFMFIGKAARYGVLLWLSQ